MKSRIWIYFCPASKAMLTIRLLLTVLCLNITSRKGAVSQTVTPPIFLALITLHFGNQGQMNFLWWVFSKMWQQLSFYSRVVLLKWTVKIYYRSCKMSSMQQNSLITRITCIPDSVNRGRMRNPDISVVTISNFLMDFNTFLS